MTEHEPAATVRENPDEDRFEIWVGDQRAGQTVYEHEGAAYAYVHTEVDPAYKGQGLATQLVRSALDSMRDRHLAVLPYCPFVRQFVAQHPDYLDLVPAHQRPHFELPSPDDAR